jgi:hypothetical protein
MPTKRTNQKRAALDTGSSQLSQKDQIATIIPSTQVPRGRISNNAMKTFRGGGKSKTMIPDSRMLHPKNRYDKRVDNKKCNIQGDKEWFRCYWCFKGPFAKLKGAHYKNCNCHGSANKANHEAAKKRHASTKSYTQMNVSSMIRVTAPPAKRQKASTSSSSSSSSNSPPVPSQPSYNASTHTHTTRSALNKKAQDIATRGMRHIKMAYNHRNDKKHNHPVPEQFKNSFTGFLPQPKLSLMSTGQDSIEYILTAGHVQWVPELFFKTHFPSRLQHLKCTSSTCDGDLRSRGSIHCTTVGMNGLGLLSTKSYSCKKCQKRINGWDKRLITSLPLYIQLQFPFQKFNKFCVNNDILDFARYQVVNRSSFRGVASGINEMINTKLIRQKSIYYDLEIRRRERGKALGMSFAVNTNNPNYKIPEFLETPTIHLRPQQLQAALLARDGKAMVDNGERNMRHLSGHHLQSDESMKANKFGRTMVKAGSTISGSLTSVRTENGEIAAVYNADKNTNFSFIKQALQNMISNNPEDGPPMMMTVDDPRKFVGGTKGTLDDELKIVKPNELPIFKLKGGTTGTSRVVTDQIDEAEKHIGEIISNGGAVGLDFEWPVVIGGGIGPITVMQVASSTANRVYLFQIQNMPRDRMKSMLEVFLKSKDVTKVGVNLKTDISKLSVDYNMPRSSHVEIIKTCIELGATALAEIGASPSLSLAAYVDMVLAKRLQKQQHIRVSAIWGRSELPPQWVEYALQDAKATIEVYKKLKSARKRAKRPNDKNTPSPSSSTSSSSTSTTSSSSSSTAPMNATAETKDPTRSAEWPQRNMTLRVLMDIFHVLQRYTSTAPKTHPLFKLFCSILSDGFYVMDNTQVEELRSYIVHGRGMTEEEGNRISKKYFKRRVRQHVPRPDLLGKRVDQIIRTFEEIDNLEKGTADYDPIITPAVLKEHKNQLKLILDGYCSDVVDRWIYKDIGGKTIKKFLVNRATSGLEGKKFYFSKKNIF